MDATIRACTREEFGDFLNATENAFGSDAPPEDVERLSRLIDPQRTLVVDEGGSFVGTAAAFDLTLTVPGGAVPAAGVTLVGVLPSHRRRGLLTRMMRAQLEEVRERGEPLAVLWASEGQIYGRFGYGMATVQARFSIERERAIFRTNTEPAGRVSMTSRDEALKILPTIYDRVSSITPGMFARSSDWWTNHRLNDDPQHREGAGPLMFLVWELDGRAEAYAFYRVNFGWEEGMPAGWLEVREAVGTSPLAEREIWRAIFGVDLIKEIRAFWVRGDHPLLLSVTEPRRLRFTLTDSLWLRVVDVKAALEARTYAADGTIVVEVTDPLFPDNSGAWRINVEGSRATVERTTDAADVRLGIEELGSIYLGGTKLTNHVHALRAEEQTPGGAAHADALFHSDVTPWCPEIF